MKYKIYKIENKINSKVYIGFTSKSLEQRLKEHIYVSENQNHKNYNNKLYKAIRKYKLNNFKMFLLFESDDYKLTLNEKENFYINFYDSYKNGYNHTYGGQAAMLNKKHSIKTKQKMKEKWTPERKNAASERMSKDNITTNAEVKEKLRKAKFGKPGNNKIGNVESCKKNAALQKGKSWKIDPLTNKRVWIL